MRYVADHDFHIHSNLSSCSNDPNETPENILKVAQENGYSAICLTDHFWDSKLPGASPWYEPQNFEHISKALPLPQNENIKFYFGCDAHWISSLKAGKEKFEFIIDKLNLTENDKFTFVK